MIDKSAIPSRLEDTQVEVNPYELTDKIWEHIAEYFESKYDVELAESYPSSKVTKPTIVAFIVKRTPGREGSKINGKGSNFAKFLKKSPDGYVHELHVQQQELIIEYSVYATSSAEVKRLAWDLERAVLETVGILQNQIEGFQMFLELQTVDSSVLWKQQDELVKRSIRFKALLPVQFTKLVPELRYIDIIETWGTVCTSGTVFTRSSSEKTFNISVDTGQRVTGVRNAYLKSQTYPYQWEALELNTDYFLKRDKDNLVYIEWNDEYGRVPSVGTEFRLDYDLAQLVKGSTIRPQ